MSILDRDYSNPHEPWMCECGVPIRQYEDVKQHEHAAFKHIVSLDDVKDDSAATSSLKTENKPSTNGVLFAGYVICYYNDRTHTSDCLLEFVSTILSQTVDVAQYYKFAHLYNRARAIYEDKIISSASYTTGNFVEQDFKKLDDFINSIGSIFDALVKSILELESD